MSIWVTWRSRQANARQLSSHSVTTIRKKLKIFSWRKKSWNKSLTTENMVCDCSVKWKNFSIVPGGPRTKQSDWNSSEEILLIGSFLWPLCCPINKQVVSWTSSDKGFFRCSYDRYDIWFLFYQTHWQSRSRAFSLCLKFKFSFSDAIQPRTWTFSPLSWCYRPGYHINVPDVWYLGETVLQNSYHTHC